MGYGLLKFDSELEMYLCGLQLTLLSMAKLSKYSLLRSRFQNFKHCPLFLPTKIRRERYRTKFSTRHTYSVVPCTKSVSVVEKHSLKHTKSDVLNIRHLKDKDSSLTPLKWKFLPVTNIDNLKHNNYKPITQ